MKKENNKKIKMISALIIITVVGIIGINYNFYSSSTDDTFIAVNNTDVPANAYFDDINFYKCVVNAYNEKNRTNVEYTVNLTDEQLNTIDALNCSGFNKTDDKKINSAKGVEKLTALTSLNVDYNNLTELDVSKNTELTHLNVDYNNLTELDVSKNTVLKYLYVYNNKLTELDVSKNTALIDLSVGNNNLTELDISKNTSLTNLSVYNNNLTELDVSKNTKLTELYVYNNKLTELDVSKNTALTYLEVYNNNLTELDVSKNTALTSLKVYNNNLTELDVSKNTKLTELYVYNNKLTELDVSKNTALTKVNINNNPFGKVIYIYIGGSASAENPLKLPSNFNLNFSGWVVSDSNVASVNEDGDITSLSVGTVDIKANIYYCTITNTIKVVEITSDKYNIDEKNNNINIGNDNSKEEILNNINKSDENIDIEVDLNKHKLYVKANNNILKTFDLSNLNSTYSDSNKYVDTTINNPKTGLYYGLVILGVLLFGGTIVVIKLKKHNKLLKL